MTHPAPSPASGFVGGDPGLEDVLSVAVATGLVHRGACPAASHVGGYARWSPAVAGWADRACTACLPGGLPS